MRDVLPDLLRWWRAGQPAALVTVIAAWGSAPRPPGAAMVVGPDDSVAGSVSGGCVEADAYALGQQVRTDGVPVRQRYGVSDDDAFEVGLTCGGILDVFVERVDPGTWRELGPLANAVAAHAPVALATVVASPDSNRVGQRLLIPASEGSPVRGSLGSDRIEAAVIDDARGLLTSGRSAILTYGPDGQRRGAGLEVFVESFAPPPRLLVFGATDVAAAVARVGTFLGYRVTVCDPRPVFATRSRFPAVDEVVVARPDRYLRAEAEAGRVDRHTAVCVLTHSRRFDVPLLRVALALDLAYVGAMGSRRTHEQRLAELHAAGLTADELHRLASPLGLDLGARTAEETAVSIAAEMVALRWGGQGGRLRDRSGRIHTPSPEITEPEGMEQNEAWT